MTRERIKDFKEIVLPFFTNYFLKENYENLGKSDAEEFEKDFKEIIELADKALEREPCCNCIEFKRYAKEMGFGIEQESCEDWNAVLDELNRIGRNAFKDDTDYDNLFNFISGLPNVKQEPKTEKCKWIRYDYRTICPQNHDIDNPYWRIPENRMNALKYCPYCGKEIEVAE